MNHDKLDCTKLLQISNGHDFRRDKKSKKNVSGNLDSLIAFAHNIFRDISQLEKSSETNATNSQYIKRRF